MHLRVQLMPLLLLSTTFALAQQRENPYAADGTAREMAKTQSLEEMCSAARTWSGQSAVDFATVAELYKRCGDPKAREFYGRAIQTDPDEPAYELFYGDYLRLYRGAGQRPLFPDAEEHLFAGLDKVARLQLDPARKEAWDSITAVRLWRSLTSLYERDGFQLWKRKVGETNSIHRPWLFFSPGGRWERSTADFDRSSDLRDLTAAALFSQNCLNDVDVRRLCRELTDEELAGLARTVTPSEGAGRVRLRFGRLPVIDLDGSGRWTSKAQVTRFREPNNFNGLSLNEYGANIEKPFTVSGTTDALVHFGIHRVNRQGLIEFLPKAVERLNEYEVSGAVSRYVGPDRINGAVTYVRQNIDPEPSGQKSRDREFHGGNITYQIYRPLPLPGRDLDTGFGRRFETRGIDLTVGLLDDKDHFPGKSGEVVIRRQDFFLGVVARAIGRFDLAVRPTLYKSRVSNDASQNNSQLRMAGNVLFRILDEERTPERPRERFIGLPVAFLQVVVPFHWDFPREGMESFRSRRAGGELWMKLLSNQEIGVSLLAVAGYSRQWFPDLRKNLDLARFGLSVGF